MKKQNLFLRLLCLICVAVMILGVLSACGNNTPDTTEPPAGPTDGPTNPSGSADGPSNPSGPAGGSGDNVDDPDSPLMDRDDGIDIIW